MSDDKLLIWANRTDMLILNLEYRKTFEYLYLYILNKCYDIYYIIIISHGYCLSLSNKTLPKIIIIKDSTNNNLAARLILIILQSGSMNTQKDILLELDKLILIYLSLDINITS